MLLVNRLTQPGELKKVRISRHVVTVDLANGKRLYYYRVGVGGDDNDGENQDERAGRTEQHNKAPA